MADKLTALEEGNVNNSNGGNVAASVNALIDEVNALSALSFSPAYCDYTTAPNITLTTTPQIVTGWVGDLPPVNITESAGRITVNADGIYNITLERIYENDDNNPTLQVFVDIEVRKNGVAIFTREAPIPSATANDEPAIMTFTTPSLRMVSASDYFEVFVWGSDNGANPQDTRLIRMKITADKVHNLPTP